jgi:hypothetical protein
LKTQDKAWEEGGMRAWCQLLQGVCSIPAETEMSEALYFLIIVIGRSPKRNKNGCLSEIFRIFKY